MQGNANTFELSVFMFIDFKARDIRAVESDGSSFVSPVKTHEVTDQSLIMQGYENHRGWTMAIDRMDGGFMVSSTRAWRNVNPPIISDSSLLSF